MFYQFLLTDAINGSQLYEPHAGTIFTWDEVMQLLNESRESNGELHKLISEGTIAFKECKRVPKPETDPSYQRDLLDLVQKTQNEVYSAMRTIPDGTPGRDAVTLSWESMRLAWYMMRGDIVGIHEKSDFVKSVYEQLTEELFEEKQLDA